MACFFPRYVYEDNDRTKPPFRVACGNCIGCRLEYAREWAVRCVHEAQMHDDNCFVTLTYNNESIPKNWSLDRRDLQLFFKRLRRKLEPERISFYACGEYGDDFGRPHYHACIFGYDPSDKKLLSSGAKRRRFGNRSVNHKKFSLYDSKEVSETWKNGFITVGEMSFESAGYCARYVSKKITGWKAPEYYGDREPEFALMSRRPAIGKTWLDKYVNSVFPKDFITHNGIRMKVPDYYLRLYKRKCADGDMEYGTWEDYENLKKRRLENKKEDETMEVLWLKRKYRKLITKRLERSLDNAI